MGLRDLFVTLVALLCLGLGLLMLEAPRTGLEIRGLDIEGTPATLMQVPGSRGPAVVLAHGFGGSRGAMHALQLTLARAGYVTVGFDFAGHGRNPAPMTEGAAAEELGRVGDAALALPGSDGRLALVGHGTAAALAVRQGMADERADVVVAISLAEEVPEARSPPNLLIVNGALERGPRQAAQRIMADVGAAEAETAGAPGTAFARRAVVVPFGVRTALPYAAATQRETLDWLNTSFGREAANGLVRPGLPMALTLLGLVLVAQPMAQRLRAGRKVNEVPPGAFWALTLVPAALTPLMLRIVAPEFLPVLAVDYLAVHLAVYGALVLGGLAVEGDLPRIRGWRAGIAVAVYGIVVVGGVLDRYLGSFIVTGPRWPVFALLLPGALLAMIADATLIQAGQARVWRRLAARAALLGSLALAALLDPGRMPFLLPLLPGLALFFASYGLIGGWVGRRTGSSFAMGIGLGIGLAWALAATFPLVEGSL